MNKAYKVIWSNVRKCYDVVPVRNAATDEIEFSEGQ